MQSGWPALVQLAATRLRAIGWDVAAVHYESAAPWHLAARRASRWRVVQVLAPATPAVVRQDRRRALGEAVRLTVKQGTMEQWSAHIRPGGRIVFGSEVLNGTIWAGLVDEAELPARLGLASSAASRKLAPAQEGAIR